MVSRVGPAVLLVLAACAEEPKPRAPSDHAGPAPGTTTRALPPDCSDPLVLCSAMYGNLKKGGESVTVRLGYIEQGFACRDEKAKACALEAASSLLTPFTSVALGTVDVACGNGNVEACEVAARYVKDAPRFRVDDAHKNASLVFACTARYGPSCDHLASRCKATPKDCDLVKAYPALSKGCEHFECFRDAGDTYHATGDDAHARPLFIRACVIADACHKAGPLLVDEKARAEAEAEMRTRCEASKDPAACSLRAAQLFAHAKDDERTLGFLDPLCTQGNAVACERLPWILARLPAPRNARGLAMLDERCQKKDADSCYHLGLIYESGLGVKPDPARTKRLMRLACDATKDHQTRQADYDHASAACLWGTDSSKLGPPDSSSVGERLLRGFIEGVFVSPTKIIPR